MSSNSINNLTLKGLEDNLNTTYGVNDDKSKLQTQKNQLKMFTAISDNNVSASEKAQIQSRVDTITDEVEQLEAQRESKTKQLARKQQEVEQKQKEIADAITDINSKSETLMENTKKFVSSTISSVFEEYSNGSIEKGDITKEIRNRIKNYGSADKSTISLLVSNLESQESIVDSLVAQTTSLIDGVDFLTDQIATANSNKTLFERMLSQVGNTGTSYTNSDTDTALPVYSLEKTAVVAELVQNSNYNVTATNSGTTNSPAYREGEYVEPSTISFAQFQTVFDSTSSAGNTVSTNAQLSALSGNYETILTTLANGEPQFTFKEAMYALFNPECGLFKDCGIDYSLADQDGAASYTINGGGDQETAQFYQDFAAKVKDLWGVDATDGTTTKNQQYIQNMQTAYYGTSYTDTTTTTNTTTTTTTSSGGGGGGYNSSYYGGYNYGYYGGYNYDYSGTTSSSDTTQPSEEVNTGLSDERREQLQGWKQELEQKQEQGISLTEREQESLKNISQQLSWDADPISFIDAQGRENTFVIDKNGDGKFSDMNEFVGYDKNSTWLDDLKSLDADGNGILEGDELKNLKILQSDYTDNASKTSNSSTTQINYSMTNAKNFGIKSINLNDLEKRTNADGEEVSNVNSDTGQRDINGAKLFNDSFTFETNDGTTYTAQRKDDTTSFMNTVYGDAVGKNFEIGFGEEEVNNIYDEALEASEADQSALFSENGIELEQLNSNIEYLKGFDDLVDDVKALCSERDNLTREDINTQLQQAQDDVDNLEDEEEDDNQVAENASEGEHENAWENSREEIRDLISGSTYEYDEALARKIYRGLNNPTADEVYEEYSKVMDKQEETKQKKERLTLMSDILAACARNGINARLTTIRPMVERGQVTNVEDAIRQLREQTQRNQENKEEN